MKKAKKIIDGCEYVLIFDKNGACIGVESFRGNREDLEKLLAWKKKGIKWEEYEERWEE